MRFLKALPLLALLFAPLAIAADGPQDGAAAPDFKLQDQNGEWHTLSQYKGQWVVLYFYPKDDTPGCTTEACNFRDDILKLNKMGVQVLGVSVQDVKSHADFAAKYHLPFPLLADSEQKVATTYGVLTSYPVIGSVAHRETFIVDPKGSIAKHYKDVDPKTHSGQVQADLTALQAASAAPAKS